MLDIKLQSEYNDLDKYQFDDERIVYYKKNTFMLHNPYSPAIIHKNGYKVYYINNNLHRLDGPARIWKNGEREYWINGDYLNEEQFEMHPERLKFLGKEHLICLK